MQRLNNTCTVVNHSVHKSGRMLSLVACDLTKMQRGCSLVVCHDNGIFCCKFVSLLRPACFHFESETAVVKACVRRQI